MSAATCVHANQVIPEMVRTVLIMMNVKQMITLALQWQHAKMCREILRVCVLSDTQAMVFNAKIRTNVFSLFMTATKIQSVKIRMGHTHAFAKVDSKEMEQIVRTLMSARLVYMTVIWTMATVRIQSHRMFVNVYMVLQEMEVFVKVRPKVNRQESKVTSTNDGKSYASIGKVQQYVFSQTWV